jgi:hypothetical protein
MSLETWIPKCLVLGIGISRDAGILISNSKWYSSCWNQPKEILSSCCQLEYDCNLYPFATIHIVQLPTLTNNDTTWTHILIPLYNFSSVRHTAGRIIFLLAKVRLVRPSSPTRLSTYIWVQTWETLLLIHYIMSLLIWQLLSYSILLWCW